jgi:lysophospholipase L1-like esterase
MNKEMPSSATHSEDDGKHQVSESKARRWYSTVAILFLNTVLLFVGVNILIAGMYCLNLLQPTSSLTVKYYDMAKISKAYPSWKKEDLAAFFVDEWRISLWEYEPYTGYKQKPLSGRFFNIGENGARLVNNQASWPPDSTAFNIFVFGGSTTFGFGLPDNQTISSFLQDYFADGDCGEVHIYNFGRMGYFSTQERILFEQMLTSGYIPNMAIFVDGLNDFWLWKGEPENSDRLRAMVVAAQDKSLQSQSVALIKGLPISQLASSIAAQARGNSTSLAQEPDPKDNAILESVIERWLTNKKLIESTAAQFNIRTVFVWQPVPSYQYDLRYHIFYNSAFETSGMMQRSKYGYALMESERTTLEQAHNFLWLADIQLEKKENLYVDDMHYTAKFSQEIASRIYQYIREQGPLPCSGASVSQNTVQP